MLTSTAISRRRQTNDDDALLRALFAESRDDLALLPPVLIDMQVRAQGADYAARFPGARHEIVMADGVDAGRLLVDFGRDIVRVVDVTVVKARRGQGIASATLRDVIAEAGPRPVVLTVWTANAGARRLYQRLGFALVGVDAGEYVEMRHEATTQKGSDW